MKKIILLLLTTCSIYAQSPRPKLYFRSGFEPGTEISSQTEFNAVTEGTDNSYLPPNYWGDSTDPVYSPILGGYTINYGTPANSNIPYRIAEIVEDPVNPANKTMHFKLEQANHLVPAGGVSYGRIQASLGTPNIKSYCQSIRLYIPSDLMPISNPTYSIPYDFLTIMEFWNNGDWYGDPYPFRIHFKLNKSANQPLRFLLSSTYKDHLDNNPNCNNNYGTSCFTSWQSSSINAWSRISDYPVPFDTWFTLRVYILEGDNLNGKVKITLTPDGGLPVDLFDETVWTRHRDDPNPNGFYAVNPFKLYTSKNLIDYVNQNSGLTHLYWDDFVLCDSETLDLQIRDTEEDSGAEPNSASDILWNSNDIWVRHNNDSGTEHENPLYNPGHPNYVKIRVNNKSCSPSKGTNDVLKLYWAKANTALTWPAHWNGSLHNGEVVLGNPIGEVNIPALAAGKDIVLTIPWENIPNPQLYNNISAEPWHFCLLARIESVDDPISSESESVVAYTRNNNNVAWKNLSVIYNVTENPDPITATVAVQNPAETTKAYSLTFQNDKNETGKPIYQEAEVTVTLNEVLLDAWKKGGSKFTNFKKTKFENKLIVTGDNATLDDINLDSKLIGTVNLGFNFLTKELTSKTRYLYQVIQKDNDMKVVGGETYEIRKDYKDPFYANGGGDKEIDKNSTVTLSAGEINSIAQYNWYDMEGNLIYVGKDMVVSPDVTKKYKLEIIDIDGYKDYDIIQVKVNPYKIESITPNPAYNEIVVHYKTQEASSAYLMLMNISNGIAYNYILNTSSDYISLDVSSYQSGLYTVVLICNGEIVDSKTLIKE